MWSIRTASASRSWAAPEDQTPRRRHRRCGIGLVALAAAVLAAASARAACTPIPDGQIASQLYSVREMLAPEQLAGTFAALRKIGFRNVERFGDTLGIPPLDFAAAARKGGVTVMGGQADLGDNWPRTLSDAATFHQTLVGSAGFGPPGIETLKDTLTTAAHLNDLGRQAAARGMRLYLHNHETEFTNRFPYDLDHGGLRPVSAWEIVAANTDAELVSFEIDIHWARRAFGLDRLKDLLAFLRKYQSRIVLLHVKDTAADGSIADLGRGTTDWPAVFAAAGPGVRTYIWEHDTPADALASAAIAYRYLRCR